MVLVKQVILRCLKSRVQGQLKIGEDQLAANELSYERECDQFVFSKDCVHLID